MKRLSKLCAAVLSAVLLLGSAATGFAAELGGDAAYTAIQAQYVNWWEPSSQNGICTNTATGVSITSYPRKTFVVTADIQVEAGKTYYVSADFQAEQNGVYGTVLFGGQTVLTSEDNGAGPKHVGFSVTPDSSTLTLSIEATPFQNQFSASSIAVTPVQENLIENNNWTISGQGSLERLGEAEFKMLNNPRKTAMAGQTVEVVPGKTYIVSGYFKTLYAASDEIGSPVSNVTFCGNSVLSSEQNNTDYRYVSFPVVARDNSLSIEIAALPFSSLFQFKDISVREA